MGKLDQMTRDELDEEKKAAEARLKEIEKARGEYLGRRVKELRGEIDGLLQREGLALEDVYGAKGAKKGPASRTRGPAKFRHPENPQKTWSGRGRQPTWYKEAIEAGTSPEDLRI